MDIEVTNDKAKKSRDGFLLFCGEPDNTRKPRSLELGLRVVDENRSPVEGVPISIYLGTIGKEGKEIPLQRKGLRFWRRPSMPVTDTSGECNVTCEVDPGRHYLLISSSGKAAPTRVDLIDEEKAGDDEAPTIKLTDGLSSDIDWDGLSDIATPQMEDRAGANLPMFLLREGMTPRSNQMGIGTLADTLHDGNKIVREGEEVLKRFPEEFPPLLAEEGNRRYQEMSGRLQTAIDFISRILPALAEARGMLESFYALQAQYESAKQDLQQSFKLNTEALAAFESNHASYLGDVRRVLSERATSIDAMIADLRAKMEEAIAEAILQKKRCFGIAKRAKRERVRDIAAFDRDIRTLAEELENRLRKTTDGCLKRIASATRAAKQEPKPDNRRSLNRKPDGNRSGIKIVLIVSFVAFAVLAAVARLSLIKI